MSGAMQPDKMASTSSTTMTAPQTPQEFVSGVVLTKVNSDRKQKQVEFRIDPEQGQILWQSKKHGVVFAESIKEIRAGPHAAYDLAQLGLPPTDLPRFLSIIYIRDNSYKSLNILAPTRELRVQWYDTVSQIHSMRQSLMKGLDNLEMRQAVWEKMYWKGADMGGDNKLDFKEVEGLFRRLNISLPHEALRRIFDGADTERRGWLDFAAFQQLVKTLKRRPEIDALYVRLCDHSPSKMFDFSTFARFMKDEQKYDLSEDQLRVIFAKYATAASSDIPSVISASGFTSFLLSPDNAVNPSASGSHAITQDMSHPLSHYYISSSHNTYLIGHQLVGVSTVEGYIRALLAGCRSVELDIYDGDDSTSEPVIKHGNTLTSKIPLRDICMAISHYAFIASPYPIIVSAEVHLNLEGQDKMVEVMKECFGDKLVRDDEYVPGKERKRLSTLPSVESLREKILLKAKNLYAIESLASVATPAESAPIEVEEPSDTSDSDDTDAGENLSKLDKAKGKLKSLKSKLTGKIKSKTKMGRSASPSPAPSLRAAGGGDAEKEHVKPMMSLKLAALLVYTVGVKCRGLPPATSSTTSSPALPPLPTTIAAATALPSPTPSAKAPIAAPHYEPEHIFSLSENKAKKMMKEDLLSLVKHCQTNLVRTYPKGIRVNSSNYEPNQFWAAGCQVVALNWQTHDFGYLMNQAMFQENGRCGYVLKPPALTEFNVDLLSTRTKHYFDVTVISAQQLPTPKRSRVDGLIKKNTIVDPLVEVSLHIPDWSSTPFIPADSSSQTQYSPPHHATSTEPTSARQVSTKTRVVKDNGFNPNWNEQFSLPFDCLGGREGGMLGLVFVRFVVWQKGKDDDDDEPLAVYCAPLASLKPGFRHLPLHDSLGSQHLFTTLFVNISIRDAD